MVHGADSVEHVHRDRPSERKTGNAYERSFEIRFGLITVTYQITGYSADGKRWRSRAQMLRRDGTVAATVTTNGAWFGLRSRRIEAPPPELVSVTDSIKSEDFVVLAPWLARC
jgi:hypothetical protein